MKLVVVLIFFAISVAAGESKPPAPEPVRTDLAGQTIVDKGPDRSQVERTYDKDGLLVSKVDLCADGRKSTTLYSFDERKRLVMVQLPDGSKLMYEYHDKMATRPSRLKLYGPDGTEQEVQ